MNTPDEATAAVVRSLMAEAGKSPEPFAAEIGMAYTTFFRSLNGKRSFSTNELFAIAAVLETTASAITAAAEAIAA